MSEEFKNDDRNSEIKIKKLIFWIKIFYQMGLNVHNLLQVLYCINWAHFELQCTESKIEVQTAKIENF